MTDRENLLNLPPADALERLRTWLAEMREAPYRAGQIQRYLWADPVASFEDMTTIPKGLRALLKLVLRKPFKREDPT